MKRKILTIVALIFSYNLIFFLQDLLKSELQVYLLGFRLNLFLLVNFIIIYFHREKINESLKYFKQVGRLRNWLLTFFIPVISTAITFGLINILDYPFKFKKPDFLIEFGLSSLIDIPVYYLWNLPVIFSTLLIITFIVDDFKFLKILGMSLLITLCFIFVQPVSSFEKINFEKFSYLPLIFGIIFYNLTILRSYNSFWIVHFSILISIYSFVLVFGSSNAFLIKTFFARMYSEWSGFFIFKKSDVYLFDLFYSGLIVLFALLFFIFDKKKNDNL